MPKYLTDTTLVANLIVTRHPAVLDFLVSEYSGQIIECEETEAPPDGIKIMSSVTADDVRGKVVVGNLPLSLASEAQLVMAVEFSGAAPRDQEYGLAEMRAAGAHLAPYKVTKLRDSSATSGRPDIN